MTELGKSILQIAMNDLKIKAQKVQMEINPKVQTWSISTAFEQIQLSIKIIREEIEKQPIESI